MSKLKSVLIVLALIAVLFAVIWPGLSALGARFGLWGFGHGFKMTGEWWPIVRYISIGLGAAALIAGALIAPRKITGFVVGGLALILPFVLKMQADKAFAEARSHPPIHDITTDMQDPPMFTEALVAERGEQANPVNYIGKLTRQFPGSETPPQLYADVQAESYPDLQPITVSDSPEAAYDKALAAVKSLGWDVFTDSPETGIIEATATTFWYGFKDDVIVRIRPTEAGSVIDVRSTSRIGVGDMGANAARIRKFRDKLS